MNIKSLIGLFFILNHASIKADTLIPTDTKKVFLIQPKSLTNNIVEIKIESPFNKKGALKDISNGTIHLILSGGFVGMPTLTMRDHDFEKKYNLKYHSFGCIRMGDNEDQEGYNQVIFEYLDKIYGFSWRKEVKKETAGLPEEDGYKNEDRNKYKSDINLKNPNTAVQNNKKKKYEEYTCNQPFVGLIYLILFLGGGFFLIYYLIRQKRKNS